MKTQLKSFVSAGKAALIMGCTVARVHQMLREKKLSGEKFNRHAWLVDLKSIAKHRRKPNGSGRPRKFSK